MAPIVSVSFTVDVVCGTSPLTVNFTNTTTLDAGFQREWLWEFGDGEISESENPSHTYTGDPGQTYDVTLSVLATDGAATSISRGTLNATLVSHTRLFGVDFTPEDAWAARSSSPLANPNASHNINFNGSQYSYTTAVPTLQLKSAASVPAIVKIEAKVNLGIASIIGSINIDGFIANVGTTGVWTVIGRLANVTTANPKTVIAEILPVVELPTPPPQRWGNDATFRTRTTAPTSTQGFGEATESAFIFIATAPVAAFSAFPVVGPTPLTVNFINETAQSNCGPAATYLWKKRISGSGDAFTQFSTAENPTEIFTK